MITVTAKSFNGGFDPIREAAPMHGSDNRNTAVQRDASTTTTTTTTTATPSTTAFSTTTGR